MRRQGVAGIVLAGSLALGGVARAQIDVIPESELSPGAKFAVAIEDNDLDKVKALLDSGLAVDTPIEYGESSQTPLAKAAWDGATEIARLLVERGADVNARDGDSTTALHQAGSNGHLEIVRLLLGAKADPNVVNKYGQTVLSNAAAASNPGLVELLMRGGAKAEVDGMVLTPLMFAAFAGDEGLIRLLVRQGANVNYALQDSGQSALLSAIYAGKPETVRLLIELGADVNARTPSGDTPLEVARNGDQEDVAAMLLAAGAREE